MVWFHIVSCVLVAGSVILALLFLLKLQKKLLREPVDVPVLLAEAKFRYKEGTIIRDPNGDRYRSTGAIMILSAAHKARVYCFVEHKYIEVYNTYVDSWVKTEQITYSFKS